MMFGLKSKVKKKQFKCPLCQKEVDAELKEGYVVMFDEDGSYHKCKRR